VSKARAAGATECDTQADAGAVTVSHSPGAAAAGCSAAARPQCLAGTIGSLSQSAREVLKL
jgi:hypothetical protein